MLSNLAICSGENGVEPWTSDAIMGEPPYYALYIHVNVRKRFNLSGDILILTGIARLEIREFPELLPCGYRLQYLRWERYEQLEGTDLQTEKCPAFWIEAELERLRATLSSDFAAIAWIDDNKGRLRWRFVSGGSNERYRHIEQRPDRGLVGEVLRIGRPVHADATAGRQHFESPIMLAERLSAALAVPVHVCNKIRGILLIGERRKRMYGDGEVKTMMDAAHRLASWCENLLR